MPGTFQPRKLKAIILDETTVNVGQYYINVKEKIDKLNSFFQKPDFGYCGRMSPNYA